jgi:hypothetical protein
LMNLFSFILELPDRFRLVPNILPHGNWLDGAKICSLDPCILWTSVKRVKRGISVKILIASIPNTVRVIISLYMYIVIILHFAKIVFKTLAILIVQTSKTISEFSLVHHLN